MSISERGIKIDKAGAELEKIGRLADILTTAFEKEDAPSVDANSVHKSRHWRG